MAERRIVRFVLALALAVGGCSDDGVPAAETGSAGTTAGDEGVATGAEVTTVSSASASGSGGTTTSPTGTSEDGTTSGVTGQATDEGGSGDESSSGGPLVPRTCESDRDCVLVDDCCSCLAQDADAPAPDCGVVDCDQSGCGQVGLAGQGVQCRFGTCEIVPASCNGALVLCEVVPPRCPAGTLPETDGAGCWTSECVPATDCDVVPDCEPCTDDETCVEILAEGGSWWSCEPLPVACAGVPTCGCMPGVCTVPGYGTCVDNADGLDCACTDC